MERPNSTAGTVHDVIIIGGGLAGLICAIELSRAGHAVALLEKKTYPFHKVCGEYVSHEVLEYLRSLGFDPYDHGASRIQRLRVSTPSGKSLYALLEPGGFGLSRHTMDEALSRLAISYGAQIFTGVRATDIRDEHDYRQVFTSGGDTFSGRIVIGSWGKRELLDKKLDRAFLRQKTGYMGVKYHVRTGYPDDEIGLDNFPGGYCGISKIEGDRYNICYLYQRGFGGNFKSVRELEEKMLFRNPVLRRIFCNSGFLFDEPEVINEISFAPKTQVENHVLLCGDSAGLITPLCGNGMSMAIAGAKMLSELLIRSDIRNKNFLSPENRASLERKYTHGWKQQFGRRLYWGRRIQQVFGLPGLSEVALRSIHAVPPLERWLIKQTHGQNLKSH